MRRDAAQSAQRSARAARCWPRALDAAATNLKGAPSGPRAHSGLTGPKEVLRSGALASEATRNPPTATSPGSDNSWARAPPTATSAKLRIPAARRSGPSPLRRSRPRPISKPIPSANSRPTTRDGSMLEQLVVGQRGAPRGEERELLSDARDPPLFDPRARCGLILRRRGFRREQAASRVPCASSRVGRRWPATSATCEPR